MDNYLPDLKKLGINRGLRKGRNVFEGYQRGWGLQHSDLKIKIRNDAVYQEAVAVSGDRTVMGESNRMNIFLLLRFFLEKLPLGHIVEYGSYRGGNAIFMAHVAKRVLPGVKVYALDSFEGLPEPDKDVDAHLAGNFKNADYDGLLLRRAELNLDNLVLVKGYFEDTNDSVMAEAGRISLAHIDCDIASAVRFSYDGVKRFMVEGGYLIFDDATVSSCIGATEAVEDLVIRRDGLSSEQIWPHFVFRAFWS